MLSKKISLRGASVLAAGMFCCHSSITKSQYLLKHLNMEIKCIIFMLVICNVSALKKSKEHGFLTGRIRLDPSSVLEYPELNGRWKPNDAVNLCEAGE